jgi:hypothetical protein
MSKFQEALKSLQAFASWGKAPVQAIAAYLKTGDEAALAQVKAAGTNWHGGHVLSQALAHPSELTEEDRRAIQILYVAKQWAYLGSWLNGALNKEGPDEDCHAVLRAQLSDVPARTVAEMTVESFTLAHDGRPTSAGRYLLGLSDKELTHLAKKYAAHQCVVRFVELLVDHGAQRLPALTGELLQPNPSNTYLDDVATVLLRRDGTRYEEPVAAACRALPEPWSQFLVMRVLYDYSPSRYRDEALRIGRAALALPRDKVNPRMVGEWLVQNYGREVLEDVTAYVRRECPNSWAERHILGLAIKAMGRDARPAVVAAVEGGGDSDLKLEALGHLIGFNEDGSHDAVIRAVLTAGLEQAPATTGYARYTGQRNRLRFITLAGRWKPGQLTEPLWALLQDKSKPTRDAAARSIGKMDEEALPRARDLLEARKADTRMTGVIILSTMNTPAALAALEARLDLETDEGVRDAMLLALEASWAASGRRITRADVEGRIARTVPKLKAFPISWLKENMLPALYFRDGGQLDQSWVRYLVYRQARTGAVRADVEARPLLEMIDRQRSGDFAVEVLKGFLASRQSSTDRGLLALATLLGDDRLVPPLSSQIRQWADGTRGKLAESAVQALALLGTDAALLTLDALSIRYRTKKKNVGQAAVDAFAAAAERLGITTDELGDRVVPWLGFEPGQPRVVDCGGRRLEVRIGMDFKLKYLDLEKNKPAASLPKSAPAEVQAALKEQAATLREVVKAQLLRLENLMVRQQRWPVGRWRELFLMHPVLLPFAVRLVWGAFDPSAKLLGTFRALEDRSLTDVEDNGFDLPEQGTVGMIHPLELSDDARQAWQAHLADYEIEPPFAQFERPVVSPKAEERGLKVCKSLAGTKVNALTFRGRAEKLGWVRGSICDGGGVTSYVKSFPLAGVDVFAEIEGLYIGIGMDEQITLENVYFVRANSVRTGSYVYDEPRGEGDPRLLTFGEVPPIVYSEAMGDLGRIAPPKAAAAAAGTPA